MRAFIKCYIIFTLINPTFSPMKHSKPQLCNLPIEQLKRGKYQPRRDFEAESLAELAESIKSSGLIQPIVVRSANNYYEIIAGERRWRAAQLAGLDTVVCLIQDYDDEEAAAVTLIENLQRKDLNPIEEAQSLQRLVDEFGYSHEEVGGVIGKSRTKITNTLRLLRLDDRVQQWLIERKLTEGQGKILAGLPFNQQFDLAQQCLNKGWSVRKLETEVKKENDPATSAKTIPNKEITRLERKIAEHLGAQVQFDMDADPKQGWLKIRYFDLETLQGVLDRLGIADD